MMVASLKPGDRVIVPWGPGVVGGTVLSLLGPSGKQFARVELQLGDDEDPTLETVLLPIDLLKKANAA
jgi:hypothetical protein